MVDISIKKVGQRDGKERFVLVDSKSRDVVSVNDVSEQALRRFFRQRGVPDNTLDACFMRARERYEQAAVATPPVNDAADTMQDDDLLFELGLGEDDDVHAG